MPTMPDVTRFFHPVLDASKLGRGPVRVLLAGQAWALFRDGSGQPAALLDRCAHRFAPLSKGSVRPDGRLACPYHGWHYDAGGCGRSPSQPALTKCDVPSLQVTERLGYLWVASPATRQEDFPTIESEGFSFGGAYSMLFPAPLHVCLDGFCEDEHTPWVHTRLGWDLGALESIEFQAENYPDRTEVCYRGVQRQTRLGGVLLLGSGDTLEDRWVTRFNPVRSIYTVKWFDKKGHQRPVTLRVGLFMVPETPTTTRLHVFNFVHVEPPYAFLLPIIKRAFCALSWIETRDDQRFIATIAETPFEFDGMRLGKYDKPLIHNHKLLRSIYLADGIA